MTIDSPLFIVPAQQVKSHGKHGGGEYRYYGDPNKFEAHKRNRTTELDNVLQGRLKRSRLETPNEKLFFEFELNQSATAKSNQPRKLLKAYHIDIEAQVSETKFFATATEKNLTAFRDSVSKLDVKKNKYEAGHLSAIEKIKNIPKSAKVDSESLKDNQTGFLYLHTSLSEGEGKEILKNLKANVNLGSKETLEFFVSPSGAKIIYGSYSRDELGEIIDESPKNPVLRFEESQYFVAPQSIDSQYIMQDTEIIEPELDARLAILDSGVEPLPILDGLIIDSHDYVKGRTAENSWHGTFAASRAIFGNNLEEQLDTENILYAKARIYDFRVLSGDDEKGSPDKIIIDNITKILDKHAHHLKVYNLSFNGFGGVHTHTARSYITRELDALSKKYNVIIINSAGNHDIYKRKILDADYPECLTMEASTISAPADGVNVLSVGSIADSDSSRSLAMNNEPSPFTRHGMDNLRKPDMVHYGGNVDKQSLASGIGVKGLSYEINKVKESAGTSFSAPLVSQVASQIYAYVSTNHKWKENPTDLTKALLLHSSLYNLPTDSLIEKEDLSQVVGFGVPDFGRALNASTNSASFIYMGTIGTTEMDLEKEKEYNATIQKIQFTVPKELKGKNKKVKVKGTLVYTPSVNPTGGNDYVECDIDINLHYFNSKGTFNGGGLTRGDDNYRIKWNPIKSFEKTFNAYSEGMWEIWLTATNRGAADVSSDSQNFALVVTIEDVSDDFEDRIDLHNIIQTRYKQYIQLTPQVRNKQSIKM